jgi:primosomal protein N' (replication factor Y)
MPTVRVVTARRSRKDRRRSQLLSQELIEAIRLRLAQGEQTMLFLNRRGYANHRICPVCGHVETCRTAA